MIVVAMLFGLAAAVPLQPDNGYRNSGQLRSSASASVHHFPQCSGIIFSPDCLRVYMRRVLPFLRMCRKLPGSEDEVKGENSKEDITGTETFADNLRAVTDCIDAVRKIFEFKPNSSPAKNQNSEGRSKKEKHQQMMMHMVFSMAFSLMSLLVGKAMSMSVMSLMAALMTKNDHGGGHHHKDSITYDIVQHPQVHYANTHSLEHVYDESSHHPVMYEQPRVIRRIHQKIFSD